MLYHVSEDSNIVRFEPRFSPGLNVPVVWGISHEGLGNYLLPRDCPRVTFHAGPRTVAEDTIRFLGDSAWVVAFESAWLDRVRNARLYCYHLPDASFHAVDRNAGYFQSTVAVVPLAMKPIEDCIDALAARKIEIRVMPNLWGLHDRIVASSLSFSMIRMRNATARPNAPAP